MFFIGAALLCLINASALAQPWEEEAVKKVIQTETEAWMKRDAQAWQNTWIQEPSASRTLVSSTNLTNNIGWESFGPAMIRDLQENPKQGVQAFTNTNLVIHLNKDMAWVHYDQAMQPLDEDATPWYSREQRVLVKRDGAWKILSQNTYNLDSFEPGSTAVRNNLNAAAYNLYQEKKLNEVIEVLKLSTKLFPQHWNAYSGLGRTYDEMGNKRLAIRNYEKSLVLNPENESTQKALLKLKQKKQASIK